MTLSRRLSLFLFLAVICTSGWSIVAHALDSHQTVSVISRNQNPGDSPSFAPAAQDTETGTPGGSLAGKIYLWVAFIAALVIFVAAVIGAILIYTRQRSKE